MNYSISNKIEAHYKALGYNVTTEESKSSDYIRIKRYDDKYDMHVSVRVSDHAPMTGRSMCADVQLETSDFNQGVSNGKYLSGVGFDDDGDIDFDEFEFDTKEDRDANNMAVAIAEVDNKINQTWI